MPRNTAVEVAVGERDERGAWPTAIVFRDGDRVVLAAYALDDVWSFAENHGIDRDAVIFAGESLRQLLASADLA
jgi:hypothetical protein